MFNLLCITSAIVIIAITVITAFKKTRLHKYIYTSDGQTQTDINNSTIQEIDNTSLKLKELNSNMTKQITTTEKLQKNIEVIHHSVLDKQASLDFLNKKHFKQPTDNRENTQYISSLTR